MKKALIITMAVAILGGLSLTANRKSSGLPASSLTTGTSVASSATAANNSTISPVSSSSGYKDGTFTATNNDNPYGTVEIAAVISGGKITDIKFLQMPDQEGHSREVTIFSEPLLKQSALSRQSANIDFVSGATDTSFAFAQSLQAALDQAKT